ncbi:hypothetical protein [Olleya marilimosa]|uniref:hypothetical protein n=1 Tax=Olleya marilimosa TaxID=272164 RepID=UPI00168D97D0|nr:hypothetical protein [Olleya marilimosa]
MTLFNRNIDRINHELESLGYHVINPIGQTYRNEMTDVEANITGDFNEQMKIVKVLKPIVYKKTNDQNTLVQKGIVIVE